VGPDDTVRKYQWMVETLAHRHAPKGDFEDAVIDGQVAVWEAMTRWESDSGATFRTWVWDKVRWAILDGQRRRQHNKRAVITTKMVPLDPYRELIASDSDDPERRTMVREGIREFLAGLNEQDEALVVALFAGVTGRDYAALIGVDESRISQRLKVLREELHRHI
jgi:RNA polymerase sigma factor (sigma-70 family)